MVQDSTSLQKGDVVTRTTPEIPRVDSVSLGADLSSVDVNKTLRVASADTNRDRNIFPGIASDAAPFAIVDNGAVVAGEKKPLGQDVLDAAKVRSKQGYFQAADRLLGDDFTHNEKKQFTEALKKDWKKEHPNSSALSRGDELLTEKNRDAVLANIEDPALRNKIAARLNGGLKDVAAAPREEPDAKPKVRPVKPVKDAEVPVENPETKLKPKVNAQPTDLNSVPDGPIKSPFLYKYDVGDRFTGIASHYGKGFEGKQSASKMTFHSNEMTAASREFPFGTVLSVTNPATGKEVKVVVTDNGPFAGKKAERPDGTQTYNRVIDLSTRAQRELGNFGLGEMNFKVLYLPENAAWGKARRNIHGAQYDQMVKDVKRLSQ